MSGQDILQEPRQAVFRVTENGESMYFSVPESVELLQAAAHLRNYLSDKNAGTKFTAIFPHGEKITQEQFDAAAAERMENTGCIAGAYELDFDARTISALNIMDGWKVYAMQDIADAAAQAYQEAEMSEDDCWRIFLDRLDGRELATPSRLTARNFYFEDSIEAMDDRTLNFYVVPCFNVDEVFGTFVETDENDHALNIYANYDMLSYISMNPRQWQKHSYVACCGTSPLPVMQMLKPDTQMVYLCLDNDDAGHKASERMAEQLRERGVMTERLVPELKDWNDDLLHAQKEELAPCLSL